MLNWVRVVWVAAALALVGAGLFTLHRDGVERGRAEVQGPWNAERLSQAALKQAQDALVRGKEQTLQETADNLRGTFNGKMAKLSGDLAAARAAVRLHRTPRPANYTAPEPNAQAARAGASCSGASLFAEDADFLVGESFRADGLRLAYLRCETQYNAARDTLSELGK